MFTESFQELRKVIAMKNNMFGQCENMDAAQAMFKKYAFKFHPDMGGDAAKFREMMDDFQGFQRYMFNNHGENRHREQNRAGSFTPKSEKDFRLDDATMAALLAVLRFHGIQTEIQGTWIWVTGDTKIELENVYKEVEP